MKPYLITTLTGFALLCGARAAIIIPGADGSDLDLTITEDTVIDLSLARPGDGVTVKWDSNNAGPFQTKGIYDPKQWVVVFKYSSVNIAAGATVTFKNHPSRAPVMWLVSGDVTIDGTVSLNGEDGSPSDSGRNAEPGPGGFRGAFPAYGTVQAGTGLGPGGGQRSPSSPAGAYGSEGYVHSSNPSPNGLPYGNPSLIPLIGGSGGGGVPSPEGTSRVGGGAGAGGILVATAGAMTLDGMIQANGGITNLDGNVWVAGAGAGGGVRLVANSIEGNGTIETLGGTSNFDRPGGQGRIRIERVSTTGDTIVVPDPSVLDLNPGDTAIIVPPADGPTARIISIDNESVPEDPRAEFGTIGADVQVPSTNAVTITIETENVEQESEVRIRVAPRYNHDAVSVTAQVDQVVSTTPLVVRWTAALPVTPGYSEISVQVVRP